MAEILFIRLGSKAQDTVHWMIYAQNQEGIIASGELADVSELAQLSNKSTHRKVVVFVPASDVAIKSLQVPSKSKRAVKLAVPYMLEDELGQDVEQLFFAYNNYHSTDSTDNCFVAVVEQNQMVTWQTWLTDAEITCQIMLPDALALPFDGDAVTAVMLADQIIIRQNEWQAMTIDQQAWPIIAKSIGTRAEAEAGTVTVNAYSSLPELPRDIAECLTIKPMAEELPLALLAENFAKQKFNLLQGRFQVKEQRSPALTHWLTAAVIAACALLLNVGMKGAQLYQLKAEQAKTEQNIIATYKKSFPETKKVRISTIRSQLKRKLAEVGSKDNHSSFLLMLSKVQPALAAVPELKPETLKFDGKRNEMRMQAVASDYQFFDKFKNTLESNQLTVAQGAQNNQGKQISGSFSITSSAGANKKPAESKQERS